MIGKRLRELREQHGYSYRELAALSNISKSAIVMYEQNKRNPKREVLEAFADIFNVDIDYLIGRSDIKSVYGKEIEKLREKAQTPPTEPKLTEGEEMLLQLFRQIPEEQQRVFLEMGRVFANNLRKD